MQRCLPAVSLDLLWSTGQQNDCLLEGKDLIGWFCRAAIGGAGLTGRVVHAGTAEQYHVLNGARVPCSFVHVVLAAMFRYAHAPRFQLGQLLQTNLASLGFNLVSEQKHWHHCLQ